MRVHERIAARRKELGLTAEQVAKALGISRSTVYRYESSDIEKLPAIVLEPLAVVLNTTPHYLMGWDDTDSSALPQKEKAPSAITTEEAIIAIFKAEKGRNPTDEELNMFRAFTKPVLDSLPDKVN